MANSSYTFKLDEHLLECFKRVADGSTESRNGYLQTVLIAHLQSIKQLDDGFQRTPDTRGGSRPRSKQVKFRHPAPTDGDIAAMLRFQSHYSPEHQLAKGAAVKVAKAKIKTSLSKYGQYLRVASIGSQIVGTIGVYPVAQSAIDGVLNGTLDDSVLIPDPSGTACYISGINILPSHRRSRRVIHGLMIEIANRVAELSPTMVYAQPATIEGRRMTLRLGFTACPGQAIADPLYQCFAESAVDVWRKLAINKNFGG
jgi:hypothetical protein